MITKTEFRGVLKNIDIGYISEEMMDVLINNKIIIEDTNVKNKAYDVDLHGIDFFLLLFLEIHKRHIRYNQVYYKLNDLIIEEIYNLINDEVKKEKAYINRKKLDSILDEDKKIKYLKKTYKKAVINIRNYKQFKSYNSFLTGESNEWYVNLHKQIQDSLPTLLKYLINVGSYLDDCKSSYKIFHFSSETTFLESDHPFVEEWISHHKTIELQSLILKEINELKNKKLVERKKIISNALQEVVYIDCLRKIKNKGAGSYSETKMNKYLEILTNNVTCEKEQLDNLHKLIDLDDVIYDNLKSKELAEKINDITGSNLINLRTYTPLITKKENYFTESQAKYFKKVPAIREQMISIIRNVV